MHPKWTIAPHAYDRLVQRAGPVVPPDASRVLYATLTTWLDLRIHEAQPLKERTFKGDRQWYLPGPPGWRDLVLVTHDDPGGVRAVVTGGWFEHDDGDGVAHVDDPPAAGPDLSAALAALAPDDPTPKPPPSPVLDPSEAAEAWDELVARLSVLRSEDGLLRARLAASDREAAEARAEAMRLRVEVARLRGEADQRRDAPRKAPAKTPRSLSLLGQLLRDGHLARLPPAMLAQVRAVVCGEAV